MTTKAEREHRRIIQGQYENAIIQMNIEYDIALQKMDLPGF